MLSSVYHVADVDWRMCIERVADSRSAFNDIDKDKEVESDS